MPVLTGVERVVALSLAVQLAVATAVTQLPALSPEPARAKPAAAPRTAVTESPSARAPVRRTTPAAAAQPAPVSTTIPPARPTTSAPARSSPRAPRPAAPAPPPMTAAAPPTTAAPPPPPHDAAAYSAEVLAAVNDERRSRGMPALAHDGCADRYADEQAARMAARGALDHQPLEPVLTACRASRAAENVGQGDVSARGMVAAWMASDGHRRNILDPAFTGVGTGAARGADGRWYACQVFVTR